MELRIHGMVIFYEVIGSGLPIIMIHGNGPDHRSLKGCMERCFSRFNTTFKRIYVDLPGYGKSTGHDWLSDEDKLFQLIIDFIHRIIPDQPFLLVGNSYGGYLARGILKLQQDAVKGLLLLCPSLHSSNRDMPKPEKVVLENDPALESLLSDEEKTYFEPVVVRQTMNVWSRYKQEIIPGLKLKDHEFYTTWSQSVYSFNVDNLEKPFNNPVLIIMGKQDSLVGYDNSWKLFNDYTRASLAIIDNAGHALQIEQPEIFESLTINWLEKIIAIEHSDNDEDQSLVGDYE